MAQDKRRGGGKRSKYNATSSSKATATDSVALKKSWLLGKLTEWSMRQSSMCDKEQLEMYAALLVDIQDEHEMYSWLQGIFGAAVEEHMNAFMVAWKGKAWQTGGTGDGKPVTQGYQKDQAEAQAYISPSMPRKKASTASKTTPTQAHVAPTETQDDLIMNRNMATWLTWRKGNRRQPCYCQGHSMPSPNLPHATHASHHRRHETPRLDQLPRLWLHPVRAGWHWRLRLLW